MWTVLSIALSAVSLVCAIIILIDAFQDEVWKGLVGLLCGLYLLYYAIVEFDHPNKWLIIIGWLASGIIGGIIYSMFVAAAALAGTPM